MRKEDTDYGYIDAYIYRYNTIIQIISSDTQVHAIRNDSINKKDKMRTHKVPFRMNGQKTLKRTFKMIIFIFSLLEF